MSRTPILDLKDLGRPARVAHQWPVYLPSTDARVPEAVREAANEAEKCFAVGALNACVVMARRAADALAQAKKAKGSDLYERLKDLKDRQVITPDLWSWGEEFRVAGKHGAHPEWEDLPAAKIPSLMAFLRKLLEYVFILPAELATLRIKANSKKKNP